jgi:proteasome lid subunit RPN8/RPN11
MTERDDDKTDARSPRQPAADDDSDRSVFADLLERVEGRKSGLNPEEGTRDSDETTIHEPSNDPDPLDRVRELIPEGLPPPPIDSNIDGGESPSSGNRLLYTGILLGIVIAFLLPGVVAFTVGHATDTVFAPPPADYVGANETLHLAAEDAAYLNRIFRETSHEVAYCGLITDDERPRLTVWMANTVNASPEQVSFITDNCPDATHEVLIHTHPNGVLQLSEEDKQVLERQPERFMCVQGGQITTEPGAQVENLACYQQMSSTETPSNLIRIPIVIIDDANGIA